MKLKLEATPEELTTRGDALVKALSSELRPFAPELAEALSKALESPPSSPELRHQALRDLQAKFTARAERARHRMLAEIGEILDEGVQT